MFVLYIWGSLLILLVMQLLNPIFYEINYKIYPQNITCKLMGFFKAVGLLSY
jgi:hypothetical protein